MSPAARHARVIVARFLLIGCLITAPISFFTFARNEPRTVLVLSWIALIIAVADLLATSQVHHEQGQGGDGS